LLPVVTMTRTFSSANARIAGQINWSKSLLIVPWVTKTTRFPET
jgi:hypothetical protein